jgi:hypothetical protein
MTPDKGADLAAAVARRAGVPLRIAGKQREADEVEFFNSIARSADASPRGRFSIERMTENHLRAYDRMVDRWRRRPARAIDQPRRV